MTPADPTTTAGDPTPDTTATAAADPMPGDPTTAAGPGGAHGPVLPVASTGQVRATAARLLGHHRGTVARGAIAMVVATAAALAVPLLLGGLVDVVTGARPRTTLPWLLAGLALATVLQGVSAGIGIGAVGRLGESGLATLREEVVDRALAVPLGQVEEGGTGDLVARVCGDVDVVAEAMKEAVPEIITSVLLVTLTVVGLAAVDWRLALAGLAAAPVQVLSTRWYLRRSRPLYAAARAAEGRRTQRAQASMAGARTVRALRLQARHLRGVEESSADATALAVEASRVRSWFFAGLNAAEVVGLGCVLAASYPLVTSGAITVGGATAAALYFFRLFDPIGNLLSQLDTAQSAHAAFARLVGVSTLPPPAAGIVPGEAGPPAIALRGVRFAYGAGPDVLHGVELDVAPGEHVALVGTSGAGKTTVAKLVAGVHDPLSGAVRVAGHDVASLDRAALARLVTLVSQEVHVFAGPLADDLRLARPDATDDDVRAALATVGATAWAEDLPAGLATVVGEGGHELTATQSQQLALARLVLADPAVAVLDEATAEAGSAGARVLEQAARAAIEGRTAVVIAHRLTQAAAADRVVVLDRGRVVESGHHDELVAAGGPYAELWSDWSFSSRATPRSTPDGRGR